MLNRFERRFPRFGIHGLLRLLAAMQVLVYIVVAINPGVIGVLTMDGARIMEGQIWRLVTFCLLPPSQSIISMIFIVLLLLWIGDALEGEWGVFRLTFYCFATIFFLALAAWFDSPNGGIFLGLSNPGKQVFIVRSFSYYLFLSIFLAFTVTFPHRTINLYGILPVKAMWLGILDAALLAKDFYDFPAARLGISLGMIPFLVYALPIIVQTTRFRLKVANRRSEFEKESLPVGDVFHQCKICGRNDVNHPELEFRVTEDDVEYCLDHLPVPPSKTNP